MDEGTCEKDGFSSSGVFPRADNTEMEDSNVVPLPLANAGNPEGARGTEELKERLKHETIEKMVHIQSASEKRGLG